jgi:hypothetical protein
MKCVACGSTALVEGTLIDNSSGFAPKESSIWKSMFGAGTARGPRLWLRSLSAPSTRRQF